MDKPAILFGTVVALDYRKFSLMTSLSSMDKMAGKHLAHMEYKPIY